MKRDNYLLKAISLSVPILAVSATLTYVAYGPILSFPFLFDDIIHLRWLEGRGLLDVWTDATHMQHYRPLVASLWVLSRDVFGAHHAQPLHLLSLLLHLANGYLVGWLAYQMFSDTFAALVATSLFVAFPFSYQVMPSPGSQSKPLSTFLILLACVLYWQGRMEKSPWRTAGALLCALLAPFAYEAAVTSGGFLILIEILLWRQGTIDRFDPRAGLLVLVGVPFIAAWKLVPSSYDPLSFPGWEALWQSSIYFVQGLTWPLALFAKPLMVWTGMSDGTATGLVAYASFAALALWAWRRGHFFRFAAFGAWYALALVVQWVTLSFRYVIDAPRILYTASVGMALLWADGLAWLFHTDPFFGRVLSTSMLTAFAIWGVRFARVRVDLCDGALGALEDAREYALQADAEQELLFVNVPSWLAPAEEAFALGHEGYTLLPPYYGVGLDDYVYVNTGVQRHIRMGAAPEIRQPWRARIGYHEGKQEDEFSDKIRASDRVWVLGYAPHDLTCVYVGGMEKKAPGAEEMAALFGEHIVLHRATLERTKEALIATLYWETRRPLEGSYTVFVHLYNDAGRLIAQADGFPLGGTFPFAAWRRGDAVRDVRYVNVPRGSDLAEGRLGVGLYHVQTGERLPGVDSESQPLDDQTFSLLIDAIQ
ncbi:MAG: hypothetical protein U9R48_09190 [Chloroflexota bacterium]|nr:hypothetical protein [Chloroflexota bacterium]